MYERDHVKDLLTMNVIFFENTLVYCFIILQKKTSGETVFVFSVTYSILRILKNKFVIIKIAFNKTLSLKCQNFDGNWRV